MLQTVFFMKVKAMCFTCNHLSTYPDTFSVNTLIRMPSGMGLSLLYFFFPMLIKQSSKVQSMNLAKILVSLCLGEYWRAGMNTLVYGRHLIS